MDAIDAILSVMATTIVWSAVSSTFMTAQKGITVAETQPNYGRLWERRSISPD